jgi:hypothetical protein
MIPLLLSLPAHAAAPVAEAGMGLVAYVGDTVELNGSGSSDADGDALAWAWTQQDGPTVELEGADGAQPRFEVTEPGTYVFSLVVSDTFEASEPDTVSVVVPYRGTPGDDTGCASASGAAGRWILVALAGLLVGRRRQA